MGKRPQTCFTYLHTAWYHYHPDNLNQNELIPPSLEKFAGTNAGVEKSLSNPPGKYLGCTIISEL